MIGKANKALSIAAEGRRLGTGGGSSVEVVSVAVCFAEFRREVGTVAELDELLDEVSTLGESVLVELVGGVAVLNIGLGLPDAAVVLYRDANGSPWGGRTPEHPLARTDADLVFTKGDKSFRFFAHAGVRPSEMREAAREFVRSSGARPTVVEWVAEGVGTGVDRGRQDGS